MKHLSLSLLCCALGVSVTLAAESEAELRARAAALHQRIFTIDTHVDTPMASLRLPGWNLGERHDPAATLTQCDLPRMREGGLDAGVFAIYLDQGRRTPEGLAAARDTALRYFVNAREHIARHPDQCELALSAADGPRIAASGRRAIYLSIENGYAIGRDLSLLATYYQLGARIFGFVHNGNNDLADSIRPEKGPEWNGLSPLGREAVQECNRLGLVIDASHAADATLRELIERSQTPVMLSHSACRAVSNHPRNVPDDLLRAVAARGGVIQMNSVAGFMVKVPENPEFNAAENRLDARYAGRVLSDAENAELYLAQRRLRAKHFPVIPATFDDFLKHLFHAIDLVGADHVGIGADMDGGGGVVGLEDVSAYPKITLALLRRGLSEGDVEKIWGGNTLRLMRAAEDFARQARAPAKSAAGGS